MTTIPALCFSPTNYIQSFIVSGCRMEPRLPLSISTTSIYTRRRLKNTGGGRERGRGGGSSDHPDIARCISAFRRMVPADANWPAANSAASVCSERQQGNMNECITLRARKRMTEVVAFEMTRTDLRPIDQENGINKTG